MVKVLNPVLNSTILQSQEVEPLSNVLLMRNNSEVLSSFRLWWSCGVDCTGWDGNDDGGRRRGVVATVGGHDGLFFEDGFCWDRSRFERKRLVLVVEF